MRRGGTTDGQSFPSPGGRGDQRGAGWRGCPAPSSICRSLRLMRRSDWRLLALSALYAAVVIPISLNKGSDFDMHLHQAELLLAHRLVYAGAPSFGAWWPPLPLLALVPFVWLAHASVALAKGSFALANVACLAGAVWCARQRFGRAAWLALAAVGVAAAVPWGPGEGLATLQRWAALSVAAVPEMHGRSQSLPALLFRAGVPLPAQAALELALLVLVLVLLARREEDTGVAL